MEKIRNVERAFQLAKEFFADRDVDVEEALHQMDRLSLSLPCWQGDDVTGFENRKEREVGGGLQVTGRYPGKARTADELRMDLDLAFSLIPGFRE